MTSQSSRFADTTAFIPIERQMAEQTGASEPLDGATTAQGADKDPSSKPAALTGRRKGGKNWTVDE
jgi:hypothetical protein